MDDMSELEYSNGQESGDILNDEAMIEGSIEQRWNQFVTGLYGVLYVMSQDDSASQSTVYMLAAIEAMQMTFFAFIPDMDFHEWIIIIIRKS